MKLNRVNFNNIIEKYKSIGKGNVRLTQSTLFLTKDIDSTKTVYNFDVLEQQSGTVPDDNIQLNINDEFIVTDIGIYLQANIRTRIELTRESFICIALRTIRKTTTCCTISR
jgi:ethanolamine utilization protein EutA (predicted chaperonin)